MSIYSDEIAATRGFLENNPITFSKKPNNYCDDDFPSDLCCHLQLNEKFGMYSVIPSLVYQFRQGNYGNMTFIKSRNGWILIDPTDDLEDFQTALTLLETIIHDNLQIKAIVLTKNNVRWWSNLACALKNLDEISVYTPDGFLVSMRTIILGGNLHQRKQRIENGYDLIYDKYSKQSSTIHLQKIPQPISHSMKTIPLEKKSMICIDGLNINILYADETPNYIMYIPDYLLFFTSDLVMQSINKKTGIDNAKFLDKVLTHPFCHDAEVRIGSYHWPTWGNENIVKMFTNQRNLHRVILQQTMFYANQGFNPNEIIHRLCIPDNLKSVHHNKEFFGTFHEHVISNFQKIIGRIMCIDPKYVDPIRDTDIAIKMTRLLGKEKMYKEASRAFDQQEYAWSIYLLNQLIFMDPTNIVYKDLLACVYQEKGERMLNPIHRNIYLNGANELIKGTRTSTNSIMNPFESWNYLSAAQVIDYISVHLDFTNPTTHETTATIEIYFTDKKENVVILWDNGALMTRDTTDNITVDLYLIIQRDLFVMSIFHFIPYETLCGIGLLKYKGNIDILKKLIACIRNFDPDFSAIESLRLNESKTEIPNIVLPLL